MPITLQQVLTRLDTDEPDYSALATLGPEAVPHLKELVKSEDPGIAAKAAYLASMIQSEDSPGVLEDASSSPHESVRVAAAAGMRNMAPAQAGPWVERLLDDADAGVRKQALQAVSHLGIADLESKVKTIAASDPEKGLRELATQGLQKISADRVARSKEETAPAGKTAKRATRPAPKK